MVSLVLRSKWNPQINTMLVLRSKWNPQINTMFDFVCQRKRLWNRKLKMKWNYGLPISHPFGVLSESDILSFNLSSRFRFNSWVGDWKLKSNRWRCVYAHVERAVLSGLPWWRLGFLYAHAEDSIWPNGLYKYAEYAAWPHIGRMHMRSRKIHWW